jgi:hypothetical protein
MRISHMQHHAIQRVSLGAADVNRFHASMTHSYCTLRIAATAWPMGMDQVPLRHLCFFTGDKIREDVGQQ